MREVSASSSLAGTPAFEEVFERYFGDVCGFLCRRVGRELGEELTAETFAQAFRVWARFDRRRGEVRPWLFGIASNVMRAHWRGEVRRLRALARVRGAEGIAGTDEIPLERLPVCAQTRRLAGALAKLRPGDRDVLLLVAWADLSSQEIALALAIPAGTARSRLNRARRQVQAALAAPDPPSHRPIGREEVIDG